MDKEAIDVYDLTRILQGEVPLEFYIELVIRAVAVYCILIGSFRLMGKRMATQMTRNELAAVATLAAAVGIPLQAPDRGIIPGVIIAGIVIMLQRLVSAIGARNERFERTTQGKISTLVEMGQLQLPNMRETRISRERVFSQLRNNQVRHLGEVDRLYLEANGSFSLVKRPSALPGLSVLPGWDVDFVGEQPVAGDHTVCGYCGCTQPEEQQKCPNCKHELWVKAIQ